MAAAKTASEVATVKTPVAKKRPVAPKPAPAVSAETVEAVPAETAEAAQAIAQPIETAAEATGDVIETATADTADAVADAVAEAPAVEIPATMPAAVALSVEAPVNPVSIDAIKKGFAAMTDTLTSMPFGASSEKATAMLGDFNARAKSAAEKSAKIVEEMSEFTKGNVEAIVASSKIAAKGAEALGADVAEYGKKSLEGATSAFKSFATVKSPTELFQLQSEYAKTSFDSAVAEASKFSEAMVKLAGDMFQPISSRFAVAAEKVKSASL